MWTPRLIPCLLLRGKSLVKTVAFKDAKYVGDPITAVQIFNEKEVDEIVVLDIQATGERRGPNLEMIEAIACECFMPLAYGGGVTTIEQMESLYSAGVEKVVLNTALVDRPGLVEQAAARFGSQSVIASIDARKRRLRGLSAWTRGGTADTGINPAELARLAEERGAGEILVTSIDRDGTGEGFDLELVRSVSEAVRVPVIASGGAGSLDDVKRVLREGGATAAAVGSLVVYHGRRRAVLINFPPRSAVEELTALE